MRKKSHISLARDIVRNSEDEGLRKAQMGFLFRKYPAGHQTFLFV